MEYLCETCGEPLEHEDTFGNLNHCLVAIGCPKRDRVTWKPVKAGDIWRCDNPDCPDCGEYWYTFVGENDLVPGYPC